jgi:hypothetical protein
MSQGQKDFLALSHGQEWVSFYESFDKLVQDNLSRSSDLLRRAMSLPEVADREVQQVRTEMEEKISAERATQRELLSALQQDLTGSHRQVSLLARGVGAVIGDLERLAQRVNDAISTLEAEAAAPAPDAQNGAAPRANGVATAYAAAPADQTPVFVPEEPVAAEEAPAADELELPSAAEVPSDISLDDITAAVEEQAAMLEAAEDQLEDLEDEIDLSALAEAEVASVDAETEETEGTDAAPATADAGERPRPHWLSVTRVGSRT